MNWAFVDYENVGTLEALNFSDYSRIFVFCGPKNKKIKVGEMPVGGFCPIELIGVNTMTSSNLDFHMAFYLGRFHEIAQADIAFHIIRNDAGLNGLVDQLKKIGRDCKTIAIKESKHKHKRTPPSPSASPSPLKLLKPSTSSTASASSTPSARLNPRKATKALKSVKSPKPPKSLKPPRSLKPLRPAKPAKSTRPSKPAVSSVPRQSAQSLSEGAKLIVTKLGEIDGRRRPRKKARFLDWIKLQCKGLPGTPKQDAVFQELVKAKLVQELGLDVRYNLTS